MTRANVKQRAIDASCCCCSVLMDASNLIHHDKPITSSRSLLLLLLFTVFQVGEAIRLEHVEVPSVVAVGEPAAFLCNVDLEFDNELYSVKWYKDSEEFYEWKPKRTPSVQIYPVEGIQVDREKSVREAVVLRSVTPATAGFFRCEASGEGPAFRSVSGGAALAVVILPKRKPDIFGGYVLDQEDGTVELNCTTDASRPAAQIRWLINNNPVHPELVQETSVSRTSSGLETSFSVLQLQSRDHFPRSASATNTATVTCEAVIPHQPKMASSTSSVAHWSTLSSASTHASNPAEASQHQFQRRIASDSHQHGERIFRSRNIASAETLQSLTLRTEILICCGCYHSSADHDAVRVRLHVHNTISVSSSILCCSSSILCCSSSIISSTSTSSSILSSIYSSLFSIYSLQSSTCCVRWHGSNSYGSIATCYSCHLTDLLTIYFLSQSTREFLACFVSSC